MVILQVVDNTTGEILFSQSVNSEKIVEAKQSLDSKIKNLQQNGKDVSLRELKTIYG